MPELSAGLRTALIANTTALAAWQDITPLAATSSPAGCSTPSRPRHAQVRRRLYRGAGLDLLSAAPGRQFLPHPVGPPLGLIER